MNMVHTLLSVSNSRTKSMRLTFEVPTVQLMAWDFLLCRLVRSHRRSAEGSATTSWTA